MPAVTEVPSTAVAVHLTGFRGSATPIESVLKFASVPVPVPRSGEALVQIKLRPVNPSDLFTVNGTHPGFQPTSLPAVPGLEGMGVIAALGPDTNNSSFTVGQRVTCLQWGASSGNGTWQQYTVVNVDLLVAVPDGVSDEFAASAVGNPITLLGLLDVAALPEGEYLLINSAGSALNRMLLQLAKKRGMKVIAVVRRQAQREEILALGAAGVVVSEDGSGIKEGVEKITGGKGAYVAFDCIAGPGFKNFLGGVRDRGTIYNYGGQGGAELTVGIMDSIFRGIIVKGFWLRFYLEDAGPIRAKALLVECFALAKEGIFVARKGQHFALEDVVKALDQHEKLGRDSKVYLEG